VYEPKGNEPVLPPATIEPALDGAAALADPLDTLLAQGDGQGAPGQDAEPKIRRYVLGNEVSVAVARERVQYLNAQGQLITESLRDYTRINLAKRFESLDQFLQAWGDADRKAALIEELESHGVLLGALAEEVGQDLDPFDLLLHVAYNQPPLTRKQRAQRVKQRNVFAQYGDTARQVIDALIDKYADEGVQTIESMDVLRVPPINHLGTPVELIKSFGGRLQYDAALRTLEQELYR